MSSGWCGRDFKPRTFPKHDPVVCYAHPKAAQVNQAEYDEKRFNALSGDKVLELTVERQSAKIWEMKANDLCRVTVIEASQVGDMNFWNLNNPKKERFYAGKTRQIHSAHLNVYDRLWSNLPYLRPMATVVGDSIKYGIDSDGAGINDVIGTRCDDYTYKLITGKDKRQSCHSQLTDAARSVGLEEEDVHDVWNIFMCTGITKDTHQYFCKPSPAVKGDYIEFIADMDLLVGLSACPQGDVSYPVGVIVPIEDCHPLGVEVFRQK
ncbi:uncharacterized protein LOC142320712 [Lycorma delicatula]|uniref:uncharacterized protein LOC142320712 n=1 Tax=Lycorma delicatula TaxID=130591 RepID=UPI003F5157D9